MIFVADESVDGPIVSALREAGYEVVFMAELMPGATDAEVLAVSERSGAVLVTADGDFGTLTHLNRLPYRGILFYRLPKSGVSGRPEKILSTVRLLGEQLIGAFTVVSENKTRVRRIDSRFV